MRLTSIMLCFVALFLLNPFSSWGQGYLQTKIDEMVNEGLTFEDFRVFRQSSRSITEDPIITRNLADGILLEIDNSVISEILNQRPEGLQIQLPNGSGGNDVIHLIPSQFMSPEFSLTGSVDGEIRDYQYGGYYQGVVSGEENSLSAISFFAEDVMGFYASEADGNRVLGKIPAGPLAGLYILYRDRDFSRPEPFSCDAQETTEEASEDSEVRSNGKTSAVIDECVTTFIEVHHDLRSNFATNNACVNYVTGTLNQVYTLYLNEGIVMMSNGIHIWQGFTPYSTEINFTKLLAYRNTSIFGGNANLTQLWLDAFTSTGAGGIGDLLPTLCPGGNRFSISAMYGFFSNVPSYSWDVSVAAHEWGHNLTSRHTHACSWPGGAIDGCYPSEGLCSDGPMPSNGGTIMSYCNWINFSLGFGPLPGAKIRNAVDGAGCLNTCGYMNCYGSVRYLDLPGTPYMYVILNSDYKGDLIKINKPGGNGHNMFALQPASGGYTTVPGYNYFVGSQRFNSGIVKVVYTGNHTFVALGDGKMVKISGTGGTGLNMFAITENANDFTTVPGYSFYKGDAKYAGVVTDFFYNGSQMMIGYANNKILKINGEGGTGHNMFAVTETSGGFDPISGYGYYSGDGAFNGDAVKFLHEDGKTLIAFNNGKILKVNGTGGTGHNLFALTETSTGFTGFSGYNYYAGHANFTGNISAWEYDGSQLLMGFTNGKMLKVNALGGTGVNMFAVTETSNGFDPVAGYGHYSGDGKFLSVPIDIERAPNGQTFISFSGKKILKINGYGGTGHNMFAVSETASSFSGYSGYSYYVGDLHTTLGYATDVEHINGFTFTGFSNLRGLKVNNVGGTGHNMHAILETSIGFSGMLNYFYYAGDQVFICRSDFPSGKTGESENETLVEGFQVDDAGSALTVYPNPATSEINVRFEGMGEQTTLSLVNVMGQTVATQVVAGRNEATVATQQLPSGLYFVEVTDGHNRMVKKLVIKHQD